MKNYLKYILPVFLLGLTGLSNRLPAQNISGDSFAQKRIASHIMFLASPSLEGREPGSTGASVAADYIASQMYGFGLQPFGNSYFKEVDLYRIVKKQGTITFSNKKASLCALIDKNDFLLPEGFCATDLREKVVFAGYGIKSDRTLYDDYKGLDVRGKIVVVFEGAPDFHRNGSDTIVSHKVRLESSIMDKEETAQELGAKMLIVLTNKYARTERRKDPEENDDYQDFDYLLPADTIPGFLSIELNEEGSRAAMQYLGIDPEAAENDYSMEFGDATASVFIENRIEKVPAYNIIGKIPGKCGDSCIIIGAHYDHLGRRGNDIYYGADDNASGIAAMLTLAETLAASGKQPPVDIIFAAWTAEEKGLLGSRWFASSLNYPEKVKLYINMDMVSRSDPTDTLRKVLSAGTRESDTLLRSWISVLNSKTTEPFSLDLWYVDGHTGSDYASFIEKGIPVITFFSGFHDDYHTPRDTFDRIDQEKLSRIVRFIDTIVSGLISR